MSIYDFRTVTNEQLIYSEKTVYTMFRFSERSPGICALAPELCMQRLLIILGLLLLVAGLAWPWLWKLPFGRLPGDIIIERENFRLYFPLTTGLLLSLVLSLLLWWF